MCLYSHTKNFKKSKKNITCYKILRKITTFYGYTWYATPYMHTDVKDFGEEMKDEQELDVISYSPYDHLIGAGGFHSFKYLSDAKSQLSWHINYTKDNYVIVKSIIPPNTDYIEGTFLNIPAYVSKKIVYKNVVKL